ncbi:MAG TPA: trypsin-like peptidase domain-containing protein [Acetobacteraceae bacterium]|jgi:serine protease Do
MWGAFAAKIARSLLLVLGLWMLSPQAGEAREVNPGEADLVQRLLPGVVNIFIRKTGEPSDTQAAAADTPDQQEGALKRYFGSGFVIDPDGLILTNRHVIEGARQLIVGFSDGTRALGSVVAAAGDVDLALVKVTSNHKLPVLTLGDSDKVRVGDPVLAIGDPWGLGTSVSAGIVSALNRDINDSAFDNYIQTDAAINHGNSGGPLVNDNGDVIGINSALYSDIANGGSIGLGFAITSNEAKFIVNRLLKYGRVKAGWIGVTLQDMTPLLADLFGKPGLTGAIVTSVTPGGPAAKAGIQEGDVIERIDSSRPFGAREGMRTIAMVPVGNTAHLTVWRDGTESNVDVVANETPGHDHADNAAPLLNQSIMGGLQLSAITEQDRRMYNFSSDQTGVLVKGVTNDVFTGDRSLIPGDLILRVQDTPVATPDDVHKRIAEAWAKGHALVALLVKSRDGQNWMPLRISSMKAPTHSNTTSSATNAP